MKLIDADELEMSLNKESDAERKRIEDCVSRQMVIDEVQRFLGYIDQDMIDRLKIAIGRLPSAQSEIIRCKNCRHNGSFDTDCPIDWNGKEYCSFAERRDDDE